MSDWYDEYKEWLGDRTDTMGSRGEYNKESNGVIVREDGAYEAGTGNYIEGYEKPPYKPMLGKPDENGNRPGSPGRPGYENGYQNALWGQQEAQRRKIQAQIDAAVAQLEGQRPGIEKNAADAAQQAYISKMLAQKSIPQQMAASGLSGGMSESTMLGLNTDYENNRSDIVNNRDAAMNELDTHIAQTKATGDLTLAEAESRFQEQLAQRAEKEEERRRERQEKMDDAAQRAQQGGQKNGGGSTKPKLSFKEYERLYESGDYRQDVLDALQYYRPGYFKSSTKMAPHLQSWINQLERGLDEVGSNKASDVQDFVQQQLANAYYSKQITRQDVEILLEQYGMRAEF